MSQFLADLRSAQARVWRQFSRPRMGGIVFCALQITAMGPASAPHKVGDTQRSIKPVWLNLAGPRCKIEQGSRTGTGFEPKPFPATRKTHSAEVPIPVFGPCPKISARY